jgi:hypothetical protein
MQLAYKFGNSSLEIVSGSVGVVFSVFDNFFIDINRLHNYNTRHAAKQSYYTPEVRTNFGKFNIRFQGPTVWNSYLILLCSDKY